MSAIRSRNISKIETDLTHQHEVDEILSSNKRKRVIRRLSFFLVITLIVGYSMTSSLISQSSVLEKKEAEKAKLEQELAELKKQQVILDEEIIKLNDDEYIAKLARSEFFLSKEDEIIFTIPNEEKEKTSKKLTY